jgi:hypothetical protein
MSEPNLGQSENQSVNRVFLNDNKDGTFICPACNHGVIKHLGDFIDNQKAIRLRCKCKCGYSYRVLVERRRCFRKTVGLAGVYHCSDDDSKTRKDTIKILDISRSGLQFSIKFPPEFKVGDRIIVEFRLDDRMHTLIREMGTVIYIRANKVGLQFDSIDLKGGLGFYLNR